MVTLTKTIAAAWTGVGSWDWQRLGAWFMGIDQSLAWYTGASLRGMSFSKDGDGWRLTVKATLPSRRQGPHVVAFCYGRTLPDAVEHFGRMISSDRVDWKTDKYAT